MPSVTIAFVRAMARAVGATLREDGALLRDGVVVRRFSESDGRISDAEFFDFTQWVRNSQPDDLALVKAYADTIQADDLGVLGLAFKTAPTLRASLERIERYFRILTDTAVYCLDESGDPAVFQIEARTAPHPVLDLRNECALAVLCATCATSSAESWRSSTSRSATPAATTRRAIRRSSAARCISGPSAMPSP
ncbi:hypothetical protein GCM10017056_25010 [Seohaeicola zhoushanensis]|uniref:HTH-type transcriptional regulator AraC-type N-terminal domain-containing protein n=1 Tax=Seohaeicola zhoushanensis TaxID=1569283 RepID=A0A8J3GY20_9RHOB|nr:hypothetical protein GCM10017056_25010 [Seohaeicola zhoushanensis]